MCVLGYRVGLTAAVQIMPHPPLVLADVLSNSSTATATENVDIGGVIWKWTQDHPVSFNLQTQPNIEISWVLPDDDTDDNHVNTPSHGHQENITQTKPMSARYHQTILQT
jgi:hypothetical protein